MNLFDPHFKYKGAFEIPVNKETCQQLRTDKWNNCHGQVIPICSIDMELSQLQEIYESHKSCHELRVLENCSNCFQHTDHGHKLAQLVEYKKANDCLQLIQHKSQLQSKNQIQRQDQTSQDQTSQDQTSQDQTNSNPNRTKKTQKSNSFYLIVLIILSVFLVSYFLIYIL